MGKKGPNYYPPGSKSSGTGEAKPQEPCNSKERPLKMLEQQSPCAHSSCPTPTKSLEGCSAGPPLLFKVKKALKNQAANHFSPDQRKTFSINI